MEKRFVAEAERLRKEATDAQNRLISDTETALQNLGTEWGQRLVKNENRLAGVRTPIYSHARDCSRRATVC